MAGPDISQPSVRQPIWKNLGTRLVSGLILAFILIIPFYFGGIFWGVTLLLLGLRLIWEWVDMTDVGRDPVAFAIPAITLFAAMLAQYFEQSSYVFSIIGTGAVLALLERFRRKDGEKFWAPLGVLYIVIPCATALLLRGTDVGVNTSGFKLVFFLMLVVIAADMGAYFGGSLFKGPKLAPKLSPKKTWSGFLSGLVAGVVSGGLFGLVLSIGPQKAALWAVPVVLVSVFGDLFESLIKRRMNVKDASDLLPGHGGLLDRLDSLLMVMIAAYVLLIFYNFTGLV